MDYKTIVSLTLRLENSRFLGLEPSRRTLGLTFLDQEGRNFVCNETFYNVVVGHLPLLRDVAPHIHAVG